MFLNLIATPVVGQSFVLIIGVMIFSILMKYFATQSAYKFFKKRGMDASGYFFGVLLFLFYSVMSSLDNSIIKNSLSLNFDLRAIAALVGAGVAGRSSK